jgi:hypothetical protein
MRFLFYSNLIFCLWKACEAIQCYSCLSNEKAGKFCRQITEAQIVSCPNDSTFCNALVFLQNGKVNVNRGCSGSVSSWGFGKSECDIMSSEALMDVGVAFYQCRGDICNNIEPADEATAKSDTGVVLLTKTVEEEVTKVIKEKMVHSEDGGDEESSYGNRKTTKAPSTQKKILTTSEESTDDYLVLKTTKVPSTQKKILTTSEESTDDYLVLKTTKAPTTQKRKVITTEEAETDSYFPVKTTTTTTTKKRIIYPDESNQIKEEGSSEVVLKVTRKRGRTVFDRR